MSWGPPLQAQSLRSEASPCTSGSPASLRSISPANDTYKKKKYCRILNIIIFFSKKELSVVCLNAKIQISLFLIPHCSYQNEI